MQRQRMCRLFLVLLTIGGSAGWSAGAARSSPQQQRQAREGREIRLTGEVVQIHAPRVFTVREGEGADRELLVVSPRPLRSGFVGATVVVEGSLRRFTEAEVDRVVGRGEVDRTTRQRLIGRPVVVAYSVLALGRADAAPAAEPPAAAPESPQPVVARAAPPEERPIVIRTAMMIANLDAFAGRQVRVLHGRVVGVLEPHAFLIEPATPYLKRMGDRDRVLVLIQSAALRAPAELIVGSTVTVTGVARTLVGLQVSREVPWPARLRPEVVDRLEVRAAILATSVQSADGVELSDASPADAPRE